MPDPKIVEEPSSGKVRQAADAAADRIRSLSWTEIAIAAAAGFAVGWLVAAPRRHPSLRDIVDDSLMPWASRNIHGVYDSVRSSNPVCKVAGQMSRLRS